MSRSDPLRAPALVRALAVKARRRLFGAAILMGVSAGAYASVPKGLDLDAWLTVPIAAAIFMTLGGARYSFEVFRRREGLVCDVALWLLTPRDWIPARNDPRTDDLEKLAGRAKAKAAAAGEGQTASGTKEAGRDSGAADA